MMWGIPLWECGARLDTLSRLPRTPLGKLARMLDAFRVHLEESNLLPPGSKVLVGYSGGADSTCLLSLMHECGIDIVAAHLHHGQRADADKELALCQAFAEQLGVPFAAGRADVPRIATQRKVGLEEAGRNARYEFFVQASRQFACNLVATAHTKSDQVETVLFNLVRGAGLTGLSGIPERRGNIVRPLLPFTREETRGYCQCNGLWFHDDPANADTTFSRTRIRVNVIPELTQVNSAVEEAIARFAVLAGEEDRFLDGMAAAALEQAETNLNGPHGFLTKDVEVAFERTSLTALPPVLFRRAARLVAGMLGATASHDALYQFAQRIAIEPTGSITFEGGEVAVEWHAETVHFRHLLPSVPARTSLPLPGAHSSAEFGWCFSIELQTGGITKPNRAAFDTALDAAKLEGDLYLRPGATGDKMRPIGFDGTRKLSDLLSEAKLTKAARARLPIVCDLVGPIWAPGICVDSRVAADSGSERTVILCFASRLAASQP